MAPIVIKNNHCLGTGSGPYHLFSLRVIAPLYLLFIIEIGHGAGLLHQLKSLFI